MDWIGDQLGRALPAPVLAVWLGPVLFAVALGASRLVGWLSVTRGVCTAYTRKLFHFIIFTFAGALQLWSGLPAVTLFGSIVVLLICHAVLKGDGFPFYEAMARPGDEPHRALFIVIPMITTALGGMLANVLFGSFATVGYLVGGWGDAAGEPIGTRWGRHRYRVPSFAGVGVTRSVEGSAAVLGVSALAATVALLVGGVEPRSAVLAGVLCAVVTTMIEALSHHGLDNLTVQLAAAGTASWCLS